jgi:hypothetical protein
LPGDYEAATVHARLQLRLGETERYRRAADELIAQAAAKKGYDFQEAIWTWLLAPREAGAESIQRLIEQEIQVHAFEDSRDLILRAAAQWRAGRLGEALLCLHQADPDTYTRAEETRVAALLATVYEQLGQEVPATDYRRQVEAYLGDLEADEWQERLALMLLLPE